MSLRTFIGGIRVNSSKGRSENSPILSAPLPKKVVLALAHGGAPNEALVEVGDAVRTGQKIGESQAFVSAPVHSSVSGIVKQITRTRCPNGRSSLSVVIESDDADEWVDLHGASLEDLSAQDIRVIAREAGLVGMGGAMFPTHVKITPPPGKSFSTVIVNGAECEPFLTCDHRLMVENASEIIFGLQAWMKATQAERGYIGIEDNKKDAIGILKKAAALAPDIEIVPLATKYPQGSEKQLIASLMGCEVPGGCLPVDVGALVVNAGTTFALAEAIRLGKPLVERVITITGAPVQQPQNLRVRIGTLFSDLLAHVGVSGSVGRLISGGPMMGIAQSHPDVPVMKGTSGILLLAPEEAPTTAERQCIRCGRCVEACPIRLMPTLLDQYSRHEMWEQALHGHIIECIECGSCSYVCPSKRDLVASLRLGKEKAKALLRTGQ